MTDNLLFPICPVVLLGDAIGGYPAQVALSGAENPQQQTGHQCVIVAEANDRIA